MNITVERDALVRELLQAANIAEKRSTIPILTNVLLATENGDKPPVLRLSATDLETSVTSLCLASVNQPGAITLPAKRTLDYIRALPEGDVTLNVGANAWVTITAGRAKSRIPGMDAASFPEIPQAPTPSLTVPASAFARLIKQTAYAISIEESRFTLQGALLDCPPTGIRMVATDGHRMAIASIDGVGSSLKVLVPRRALVELRRLADGAQGGADLHISSDENHIWFRIDDRVLTARKMTGNFPDYERVLPKDQPGAATIDRAALDGALRRVCGFADDRSRAVRLKIANGALSVAATTDKGECDESLDAQITGPDLEIGVNGQYIVDFLASVDVDKITVRYGAPHQALALEPVGGIGELRCVVMPMRL